MATHSPFGQPFGKAFGEGVGASGASVTDINTDEIVLDAEQNCTYEVTGFSGDITTVQLVSGTGTTSGTDVTVDV